MIIGIGVDSVEINRFAQWHLYDQEKLARIFSQPEISYCLSNTSLSAQRFAVRFAAREALFKALSAAWPEHTVPFLTLCRATAIIKNRALKLTVDCELLAPYGINNFSAIITHLSVTHANHAATAFVVIWQRN
jgi:phosphopantetheine--protein transferase-like protein